MDSQLSWTRRWKDGLGFLFSDGMRRFFQRFLEVELGRSAGVEGSKIASCYTSSVTVWLLIKVLTKVPWTLDVSWKRASPRDETKSHEHSFNFSVSGTLSGLAADDELEEPQNVIIRTMESVTYRVRYSVLRTKRTSNLSARTPFQVALIVSSHSFVHFRPPVHGTPESPTFCQDFLISPTNGHWFVLSSAILGSLYIVIPLIVSLSFLDAFSRVSAK